MHPHVHHQLLLGYEPFAALTANMLPGIITLMSLLTEIQPTPEPVLLAAGAAAPPFGPRVEGLVVQQGVLVAGCEVTARQVASAKK